MEEMSHLSLFDIFFVAASIPHLLTAAIKFFCSSSSEIRLLCLLSLALALFLLSTSLQTLKLSRKKTRLCCCFSFQPSLLEGVDVRTHGRFVRSKISWMHRQQNFANHGAPLRADYNITSVKFACGIFARPLLTRIWFPTST